ncbi:MAG: hypothetical protein AAGD14_05370 [Planctomycetota bacterium]
MLEAKRIASGGYVLVTDFGHSDGARVGLKYQVQRNGAVIATATVNRVFRDKAVLVIDSPTVEPPSSKHIVVLSQ